MNNLQTKIFRHLTVPGHADRTQALEDLIERSAFDPWSNVSVTETKIRSYLRENPRGFCSQGIKRFEDAVFAAPKRVARIVIDVEVEGEGVLDGAIGPGGPTTIALVNHFTGATYKSGRGKNRKILSVTPVSADWKKS